MIYAAEDAVQNKITVSDELIIELISRNLPENSSGANAKKFFIQCFGLIKIINSIIIFDIERYDAPILAVNFYNLVARSKTSSN